MAARKRQRDEEKTSGGGGWPIWARFTFAMTLALALVSSAAGFLLYQTARRVTAAVQDQTLVDAVELTGKPLLTEIDRGKLRAERELLNTLETQAVKDLAQTTKDYTEGSRERDVLAKYQTALRETLKTQREERERKWNELGSQAFWTQTSAQVTDYAPRSVKRGEMEYGPDRRHGVVYAYAGREGQQSFFLILPDSTAISERSLLGLVISATFAIILVGAVVSVWVANQVARPITQIVDDVRQISTGDLDHRTRADTGGEIGTLARSIDRMTKSLAEARENEIELQVRQREVEVAAEVREQLLPQTTPKIPGYDLGHLHIGSGGLGGDFHDFVEIGPQGKDGVGLLVCEVSGKGLPGALVGATARAYLRSRLAAGGDLKEALQEINRQLARDVRRGMAVTSIYASIDAAQGIATVACTGHKVPLIRFTGADKKVRLIHPEGIALGFDKGPVFDGKLEITRSPIDAGDRLVLVNSGAVSLVNPAGEELGEKALYAHVMRLGPLPTEAFLEKLRNALEAYAGGAAQTRDVAIVTISRS